jgi:hypothetical protein
MVTAADETTRLADEGRRLTCDEVAPLSTEKGSPHERVDCWVERPMRESRVVRRREDLRILNGFFAMKCYDIVERLNSRILMCFVNKNSYPGIEGLVRCKSWSLVLVVDVEDDS